MHAAATVLGIASLALWTASFVLMLRLPVLERAAGGLDRLYWWHHACGALAYVALLSHPLALALAAAGRGLAAGTDASGAAWAGLAGAEWPAAAALLMPPGHGAALQSGWLALALLMAMMAATFWLPLAYTRWRAVHLASVPAFALGVAHAWAFSVGGMRVALAAMAAISAVALVWRYAMGRAWVRAHPHRVVRVGHPGAGLLDLDLEPEGAPLRWQPGQFVFVAFFRGDDWRGCGEYHPYTIAGEARSSPDGLRLLIRSLGDCTAHLQTVTAGVRSMVQGPYGGFLAHRDARRPQLWIAGGIGLTPFLAALASPGDARPAGSSVVAGAMEPVAPVDLVHVHRPGDALAGECLENGQHALPPGVRLTSIEAENDPRRVWQGLLERVGSPAGRQVFLCGPPQLVDALRGSLLAAGVAPQDIHSERFDFR